jgi:hypothetical protein
MSSVYDHGVHNSYATVDITIPAGVSSTVIPLNSGLSVPPLSVLQQGTPYPALIRLTATAEDATHTVTLPPVSALKNVSLSQIRFAFAIDLPAASDGTTVSIVPTAPDEIFCFGASITFTAGPEDACFGIVIQSPPPNSPAPLNTQWTVISRY